MSELPAGWVETTLGEMVRWGSGGTPRRNVARFYGGSIPWAIIGDLNDGLVTTTASSITDDGLAESSARLIPPGTVLIAMYGSIGKLGIAGVEMATNQAIAFADPRQGLDSRFLFWYLRAERRNLAHAGKGATQKNISQTVLRPWSLPLPPLNEQRRIVAAIEEHLSRLDAADASLAGALARLAVLRRVAFAEIAESAELVPLAEVAVISSGQTPKGLDTSPSGPIPYYKVGDMNAADGVRMGSARAYVTEAEALRTRLRVYPAGTVVFPKRGGAIATNKKRITTTPAGLDLNTMAVVPGDRLLAEFLLAYFETVDLASLADGSNVPQINHGDIAPLEVPVPPLEEQRRIVAEVEERLSAIDALRAAIERAQRRSAALRRAVLERAFRGELVPQNPSDEPAEALLARIRANRAAK